MKITEPRSTSNIKYVTLSIMLIDLTDLSIYEISTFCYLECNDYRQSLWWLSATER